MHADLLIDEQARGQLEALVTDPPHALLLTGLPGIGKRFVAESWAEMIAAKGDATVVEPDEKGTISIETVRDLYRQTHSKRTSRQVVIIDHAEAMGQEAQNALLKLLEEPNQHLTFVLTAPNIDSLLPTDISRTQTINLPSISKQWMERYINSKAKLSAQEAAQLLFVADGRPGTMVQLLSDPETLKQQLVIMQQAKQLLTGTSYERLTLMSGLIKDRVLANQVLEAMGHMIRTQILRDSQPKLIKLAERLELCLARLAQNGNLRAQLTALFTD